MHPCSTCATSGRAGATRVSVCSPRDGVSNQSSQAGFKSSRRCSVSASRLVVTSSTDGVDGFSTFLPGESQGQQSLVSCHLWGHTELDTTEAT